MTSHRVLRKGGTVCLLCLWAMSAWAVSAPAGAAGGQEPEGGASPQATMEYKAKSMLDRGLELLELKQEDRATKLIASVPRMFPKANVRFKAYLALGEHYLKKGQFELAIKQFGAVGDSQDDDEKAGALYQIGICYYNLSEFDKAFLTLRQVTNDYPGSVYANEAFYYIGQCHFKLGRWAKAVEALRMVGTSVGSNAKGDVTGESGQRLFIKIHDKDLIVLMKLGQEVKVELTTAGGDREQAALTALGKDGEYFIGSVQTAPGKPVPGDSTLQLIGPDVVTAAYVDVNTQSGRRNRKVLAKIQMVSTAVVGFTDGAYRDYAQGVFGDGDCFVRVKDLDLDTTDKPDRTAVKLYTRYKAPKAEDLLAPDLSGQKNAEAQQEEWKTRDSVTLPLSETGAHTGVFVGSLVPKVARDASEIRQDDGVLSAMKDDEIVCVYNDERHILGPDPREVKATAKLLIGQIQDVKIEHRVVDSVELKARKDLIEAKIFLKLGQIFKDVGLTAKALEKADLGLERVENVIRSGLKASLDRQIVEEAFSVKWELLLVQDKLQQAISVCQTLTRLFPDSALVDRALLRIGMAKMQSGDYAGAVGIFSGILGLKQSDLKADAQFHIALVREQEALDRAKRARDAKADLTAAMLAYKQCAERYPDSPYAGQALEWIANYYIDTEDYARAMALTEQVFQDYPDASFLDRMLLAWAKAASRSGNLKLAKEKCDLLLRDYPGSKCAEEARGLRDSPMKKPGS